MQWLRRLPKVPVIRIVIDGEPAREVGVDYYMGLAALFKNTPGLKDTLLNDFRATMRDLDPMPTDIAMHGELVRRVQKAVSQWKYLEMPVHAVAEANKLLEQQRAERAPKDTAGKSPTNVM